MNIEDVHTTRKLGWNKIPGFSFNLVQNRVHRGPVEEDGLCRFIHSFVIILTEGNKIYYAIQTPNLEN